LRLLLARDDAEAIPIAHRLDSQNRERQKIERGIAEVQKLMEKKPAALPKRPADPVKTK
jgi:single-stranded DNA-specific DHH superfamily exonuclease